MTGPLTADELIDAWAGTHAPTEPSPTLHPSRMPEPFVMWVVGSAWRAHEQPDGRWTYTANGKVIWRDMAGTREDAWLLLLDVHRDPSPRAETQGHPELYATDPLRAARGICLALLISAPIWFAGAYIVGRLTGWWL